jgi:hypothetical protein
MAAADSRGVELGDNRVVATVFRSKRIAIRAISSARRGRLLPG